MVRSRRRTRVRWPAAEALALDGTPMIATHGVEATTDPASTRNGSAPF